MTDSDLELERRFAELRESDAGRAPDFTAMRDMAVRGAASRRAARHWFAPAVMAAAAALVLAVYFTSRSRSNPPLVEGWKPDTLIDVTRLVLPTDGLLRSARRTLQTPALFGSVLDGAAAPIPGTPLKGD